MDIYIYIYIFVHIGIHVFAYVYRDVYMYTYICVYTSIFIRGAIPHGHQQRDSGVDNYARTAGAIHAGVRSLAGAPNYLPWTASGFFMWNPEDLMNTRILHSGSKADTRGIQKTMGLRGSLCLNTIPYAMYSIGILT